MRSEFGSRVVAASEDTTHPIGGDSAAESDETLMQRYQGGCELAFHKLYERYCSTLAPTPMLWCVRVRSRPYSRSIVSATLTAAVRFFTPSFT
jgi:hypothetical protein